MRVLRLGNSEDTSAHISDGLRGWRIAEQLLEAEIGEPVEVALRNLQDNRLGGGAVQVTDEADQWGASQASRPPRRRRGRLGVGISET